MSDRICVIDMETGPPRPDGLDADRIQLYMDGESGTWRLFVEDDTNCDFTLKTLIEFRDKLNAVLSDIERDPNMFNAEVRRSWSHEVVDDA